MSIHISRNHTLQRISNNIPDITSVVLPQVRVYPFLPKSLTTKNKCSFPARNILNPASPPDFLVPVAVTWEHMWERSTEMLGPHCWPAEKGSCSPIIHGARSDLGSHLLQLPSKRNLWGHSEFQIQEKLGSHELSCLTVVMEFRGAVVQTETQEPQVVTSLPSLKESVDCFSPVFLLRFWVFRSSHGLPSPLPAFCLVLLSLLLSFYQALSTPVAEAAGPSAKISPSLKQAELFLGSWWHWNSVLRFSGQRWFRRVEPSFTLSSPTRHLTKYWRPHFMAVLKLNCCSK